MRQKFKKFLIDEIVRKQPRPDYKEIIRQVDEYEKDPTFEKSMMRWNALQIRNSRTEVKPIQQIMRGMLNDLFED